jgi:hypothetical protein
MHSLILPERVTIQLVDKNKSQVSISNVLFGIRAFARHKNDFNLQPFPTDSDGLVTITKKELEADLAANYASAQRGWEKSGQPKLSEAIYHNEIQPRLSDVTIPAIMSALNVCESYAADIRRGRRCPNARHWEKLAELVAQPRT